MLGPVQVLVVGVDDAEGARTVLASLAELDPDGPVRCVDAFTCTVGDDGDLSVEAEGGRPPVSLPLFAEEVEDTVAAPTSEDTWHLGEVVPPGGHAVVALLEHRWAVGLRDSLLAAGATLRHETWLDQEDRASLESLLAQGDQ